MKYKKFKLLSVCLSLTLFCQCGIRPESVDQPNKNSALNRISARPQLFFCADNNDHTTLKMGDEDCLSKIALPETIQGQLDEYWVKTSIYWEKYDGLETNQRPLDNAQKYGDETQMMLREVDNLIRELKMSVIDLPDSSRKLTDSEIDEIVTYLNQVAKARSRH